eukprot:TRINITY_DN69293_c0_g1_i1.p1 TRINITY_DN69293_c0_g1~~TRINITY_DN69293_c0_g1_i1.p1  ORF type:complete len:283 (+),score=41.40 TRINITY_DN69293_c0_g1_i1:66-914(+)
MSLDRDSLQGYTRENCILFASELNTADYSRQKGVQLAEVKGTAQWSKEKFLNIYHLRSLDVDLNLLAEGVAEAWVTPRRLLSDRVHRGLANHLGEWCCKKCKLYKPADEFCKGRQHDAGVTTVSIECQRENWKRWRSTLRGHAKILLLTAHVSSARRRQTCNILVDNVLDMLLAQGGKCFHTGIPLVYGEVHVDWRMSLERLNNSFGYTRHDCVLIAIEFNTSDDGRNVATTAIYGTAQWARSKVAHVWGVAPGSRFTVLICGFHFADVASKLVSASFLGKK